MNVKKMPAMPSSALVCCLIIFTFGHSVCKQVRQPSSLIIKSRSETNPSNQECGRVFSEEALGLRVAGGQEIGVKDHPYLVMLKINNSFTCGSSILNPNWILTAGHCVPPEYKTKYMSVTIGGHDRRTNEGVTLPVKERIRHENYQKLKTGIIINDIALLRVDGITYNELVQPICLPTISDMAKLFKSALVQGWGHWDPEEKTTSKTSRLPLQTVVSLLTSKQCLQSPLSNRLSLVENVFDYLFCAYKAMSDSCQGDSGGPIIVRSEEGITFQIGLVSFGVGCGNAKGLPGIYTQLTNYRDWICKNTNQAVCVKDDETSFKRVFGNVLV